jgi:hypothetical protein
MKRFEYRLAKVNELAVATEEDTKNGRPNVTTVTLKDEPLAPSERFWTSLYARYGFSGSFFKYFTHAEVFGRISSRETDSLRVCIERDTDTGKGRLLAVSSPGKPIVRHDDLLETLGRYRAEKVTCVDGVIESTHTPRAGSSPFQICGDAFSNRFVMAVPIDGYGQPNIYLSLLRHICSNGAVGYAKAFRSSLALGRGEDDVNYTIVRALDGFGNDEGFAALRQRFEAAGKSWASVAEAQNLYRQLVKLIYHREVGSDGAALVEGRVTSTLIESFHTMTGDISKLYGIANPDALSVKRQRTLPVSCKVYDLLNMASEVATHHATDHGARACQAWLGTIVSGEYDLENSCDTFDDFQDYFVERKLDGETALELQQVAG